MFDITAITIHPEKQQYNNKAVKIHCCIKLAAVPETLGDFCLFKKQKNTVNVFHLHR